MISGIGFILMAVSGAILISIDNVKWRWLLVLLGIQLLGLVLLVTGILN